MNNKKGLNIGDFLGEIFIFLGLILVIGSAVHMNIVDKNNENYCKDNGYENFEDVTEGFVCYKYIQKQNDIGYEIKYSGIIRGIVNE